MATFRVALAGEDIHSGLLVQGVGFPDEAAEYWAAWQDQQGDYDIVGQRWEPVVVVADAPGGNVYPGCPRRRFTIIGEAQPVYYTHEHPAGGDEGKP